MKIAFEMDDLRPDGSRGDVVTIEVSPDNDGDDGDDDDGPGPVIVIKTTKPDKPRPKLHIVSKPPAPVDEEDTSGAEAWYAHMLS